MNTNLWKFLVVLLALALATPTMAQRVRTKGTVSNSVTTQTNSSVVLTSPK